MIGASEALALPSARLTEEEAAAVGKLDAAIDAKVRESMGRRGLEMKFEGEPNGNVIAEVNQRLKQAGWQPEWQMLIEQNRFNAAIRKCVGFTLKIAPSDEAYSAATRSVLS